MARDEWEQLKADALERQSGSAHMQLTNWTAVAPSDHRASTET
ncbi:hypothetical protein [Streptomyces salinarius]|uniref:Uncharacterized protein n=1 Tax=Streptomyces salinarius TaxID=2762598 RepID=A0ABW8BJG7_9ACTN